MKDSSLAWHLLEAHDKGCNSCSAQEMGEGKTGLQFNAAIKDASMFKPAVVAVLRQMCHRYLDFEDSIVLDALLCVEIDQKSTERFSIKEVVQRHLTSETASYEKSKVDLETLQSKFVPTLNRLGRTNENINVEEETENTVKDIQPQNEGVEDRCREHFSESTTGQSTPLPMYTSADLLTSGPGQSSAASICTSLNSAYSVCGGSQFHGTTTVLTDSIKPYFDEGSVSVPTRQPGVSTITQSHTLTVCQNYDEADNSTKYPNVSLFSPGSVSASSAPLYTSSKSWLTHCRDSQMCEPHEKVVISHDGTTRIVHNGSASENVIRIDLSKHPIETLEQRGHSTSRQTVTQQSQDNQLRTDDIGQENEMVKFKRQSLRVIDSGVPCTASSPLVESPSQPNSSNSFPLSGLFSPTTLLANFPQDFGNSATFANSSGASSMFKVLQNTLQDTTQNKEVSPNLNTSMMSDGYDDAESNGDVPLDMSVKNEEDTDHLYTEKSATSDDTGSISQSSHRAAVDQKTGSTFQNVCSSSSTATTSNSDLVDPAAAASSVQLLKHYTERLMQHQMTSDMSSHVFGVSSYSVRRKRRFSDADEGGGDGDGGRGSGGTIWPRKDMTQKEEYQHLEMHPFMDFAEMLRSFPNMQQRTFYRWKRRIKDQFMFLEGQPSMTYTLFRQYFPNVKENVFEIWRSLMDGGQRFMADGSKPALPAIGDMTVQTTSILDKGSSTKGNEEGVSREELFSAYYFLQHNFTVSEDNFFQAFPNVSKKMFQEWRTRIIADFFKLQANPSVTYQEFQKQVTITEDTFDIWKSLLPKKIDPKKMTASSASPVSASTSLSSSGPTLPPVSLLAASTKAFGTSWYNSYSTLLGQLGLQFWPSLSLLSGSSLAKPQDQADDLDVVSQLQDQQVDIESVTIKQNRSDDTDGEDGETPGSLLDDGSADDFVGHRSSRRLTLKPEHHYYLLHPDITYLALTSIYPGVSAQRFSRWRRKVTSALALLTREPDVSDEEFALSFPNVPSEVLALWRKKVQLGQSRYGVSSAQDLGKEDTLSMSAIMTAKYSQASPAFLTSQAASPKKSSRESSLEPEMGFAEDAPETDLTLRYGLQQESPASLRKHFKMNKEEFQFVMRYPSIDITTFSQHHPTVSVRTFYRWRGQIRKAINLIRDNPSLGLRDLKKIVPEATEEVVMIWKMHVQQEALQQKEGRPLTSFQEDGSSEDYHHDPLSDKRPSVQMGESLPSSGSVQQAETERTTEEQEISSSICSPAQLHVHMNPHMEFAAFSHTFPEVSKQTFYQWKKEVETVMDYIRQHPTLTYEEVVSVVPHITRNAFNLWMHVLLGEGEDDQNSSHQQEVSSHAGSSSVSVDSVSASGRMEVVDAQTRISRDTDMEQMALAYHNQLAAAKEVLIQQSLAQARLEKDGSASGGKQRCQSKDELIQVMLKPSMDYNEYKKTLGGSSQRTFYRWKANIKLWREAVSANPTMSYSDFTKITGEVPLQVFEVWQNWELNSGGNHGRTDYEEQTSTGAGHSQQQEDDFPVPSDPDLAAAQELLQRHPDMQYEDLVALKPCVTAELYRNWQKCIAMRIEYIRLIPEKTFDYFSNIFKTIKEEVFNIWKDIVLKQTAASVALQNNFLYPSSTSSDASYQTASVENTYSDPLTVSVSHSYKTNSQYYHPSSLYATSSTVHGEASSKSDQDSATETEGSLYTPTTHGTTSHSPRVQSISPARSDSHGSETVRVKIESSPNTPLPSFTETVSNLSSRSAHRQPQNAHSSSQRTYNNSILDSNSSSVNVSVKISNSPSAVGHSQLSPAVVGHGQISPAAVTVNHAQISPVTISRGQLSPAAVAAALTLSRASDRGSLSLSHQSSNSQPADKNEQTREASKDESKSSVGENEDSTDTTMYSSQRQRKLQREEYIFVAQNPDIDVQEFLKQYPTVSVRSFYRWKQEILRRKRQDRTCSGAM